jgi:fructokinase
MTSTGQSPALRRNLSARSVRTAATSMPHTIVGVGEALWDMLPSGKHLGGAPLNFAYIASLLGDNAIIATRIGADSLGEEIRSELNRHSLDLSGIQIDSKLPTGTVNVSFQNGQPSYEIRQPVAWDALEWSAKWHEIAVKSHAVCFVTLAQRSLNSRKTIQHFLENTRRDCLRVFDINLRTPFYSREIIESALRFTTVLKMNDVELPEIAAMFGVTASDPQTQMLELRSKFDLEAIFVTRGEHGAMAANRREFIEHRGFSVRVHDTIGAGDAFTAAATHCLLAGVGLEKTLKMANRWASWVASQAGGMPAISEELRSEMLSETAVRAS